MAEEENTEETSEETPVEETPEPEAVEEAPAAEEAPEPEAAPEPDPEDDLPWKERKRLAASRKPAEAKPERDGATRSAERDENRKRLAAARGRRRAAEKAASSEKGTGTPPAEHDPNAAKVRQGIVVSDKADKTITVRIDIARRHPTYEKVVRRSRTLHAHDEQNEAGAGDTVRIVETRPLSKLKRWRLVEIVEKAK